MPGTIVGLITGLLGLFATTIVFFVLVLVASLTLVWVHEGLAVISAIWVSMLYLVFGGLVAVPTAVISLGITGVSATVTPLVEKRLAEPTANG